MTLKYTLTIVMQFLGKDLSIYMKKYKNNRQKTKITSRITNIKGKKQKVNATRKTNMRALLQLLVTGIGSVPVPIWLEACVPGGEGITQLYPTEEVGSTVSTDPAVPIGKIDSAEPVCPRISPLVPRKR